MTNANETKSNTETKEVVVTKEETHAMALTEYNVTDTEITGMVTFLNGRHKRSRKDMAEWMKIGIVLARVDANTTRKTRGVVISELFGADMFNSDEVNYSIRMANEGGKALEDWYKSSKCTKFNPRYILAAFLADNKSEETKTKEAKERKEAKEQKDAESLTVDKTKSAYTADDFMMIVKALETMVNAPDSALTGSELNVISAKLNDINEVVEDMAVLQNRAEKVEEHREEKKTA